MRPLLFVAGVFCAVLGGIGIVLPVLPTVPFWLLATACFAKSSPRFHAWFVQTKLYHKYIEDYFTRGGFTTGNKIRILTLSTTMMLLAIFFAPHLSLRIFILILMVIKYYVFLFHIPTVDA